MRTACLTLFPMFAAAILVLIGGERLAREQSESVAPIDRERLFPFAEAFREELERLESLYIGHLENIADGALLNNHPDFINQTKNIVGVQLVRVFRSPQKSQNYQIVANRTLPEIEIDGGKTPLTPGTAIVLSEDILSDPIVGDDRWVTTNNPNQQVYLSQPQIGVVVAILIDRKEVWSRVNGHVSTWQNEPATPLREANERVVIQQSKRAIVTKIGPESHGPASAIIPFRNQLGEWQITAWDGITTHHSHNATLLAASIILALVLAAAGVWLLIEQKRAVKLAADRVSFVNRASHELGTPLTNVLLNLDLATQFLTQRPVDAQKRLGLVTEEVERLARLVSNILTFSRSEKKTLSLSPAHCSPEAIVKQAIESFRPALSRRGIRIETEISCDESAFLDPDALSQIVSNLISNVEKYASSGGWIRIECGTHGDKLSVKVADKGPGIPRAKRENIFSPFERISSKTSEGSTGTGLGLTISRELAERLGGSLEILESAKGAVFCLTVPLSPSLSVLPDSDLAV